ncbi:MAG: hypothetical protein HOL07_03565 [Rhodospirillaceae bacterium]|jgi:hypothetical protein|nr:hypothetical protein [Rhodospirillaceae bacterium]MBT3810775.1 hypothetical protein [Rhodospirillaceae bacterium]MBT4773835.1 hypothetical protein [Rhodospirillaceae bacterium]MBT5357402.1 hypothetical protein [Rhodospirillaceae bacterium]MBT5770413.1 hypothetical protein [Rhodospirillaceae bacterium]
MRRGVQTILAIAAPLALAACAGPASLALGGASVVTVLDSGKTVSDHVMSFATGEECTFRHSLRGESWCQPKRSEDSGAQDNLVCYRSLARTTCYEVANKFETETRRTP